MIRHWFATPSNPVSLARPEDAPDAAGAAHTVVEVATNWWVMIPLLLVGAATIMTVQLRLARARRLPDEEKAFRLLARAARVPGRQRVMVRALAKAHGDATPAALLLSDHATAKASARIELKPGTPGDRLLRRVLASRGIADPRPVPTPQTPHRSRKNADASPKKGRVNLRA